IALFGGALGVLLARLWLPVFTSLFPTTLPVPVPGLENVGIDRVALLFALVASFVTALLFGTIPALAAATVNPIDALKEEGRTTGGSAGGRRGRMVLVAAEIALAVVLLIGAGLMTRSFIRLQSASLGFEAAQVLSLKTPLPRFRYPEPQPRVLFYSQA